MSKVIIERVIDASPPRVWKALTDKAELSVWLPFFGDFEPVVGYEVHFKLGRDPKHLYEHISKVIEVEEAKKLVYGWRYEGYAGDSRVTFELSAEGTKTKVILTHEVTEAFPTDNHDFDASSFKSGWTYTIDGLKQYIDEHK